MRLNLVCCLGVAMNIGCTEPNGARTKKPVTTEGDTGEAGTDIDSASPDTGDVSCGGDETLPGGLTEISLVQTIDGAEVDRRVVLHAAAGIEATSCVPVMLAFHGNGGAPEDWVSILEAGVESGAFVGVYPEGHLRSWNTGHEASTADDVGFAEAVLDAVSVYTGLDTHAPVAQGQSNGAGLVHRLGMDSARFTGLAATASPLIADQLPESGAPPVSVLQIQGTADSSVPYEGGSDPSGRIEFLGAEESSATWAAHNGCEDEPAQTVIDETATRLAWEDCAAGTRVVHVRVEGGGHILPADIGGDTQGLVWEFLSGSR